MEEQPKQSRHDHHTSQTYVCVETLNICHLSKATFYHFHIVHLFNSVTNLDLISKQKSPTLLLIASLTRITCYYSAMELLVLTDFDLQD